MTDPSRNNQTPIKEQESLRRRVQVLEQSDARREQVEQKLRGNEERYQLITDNVRDTLWLMDMKMQTTWISPSVVRTRGFTLEELRSLPLERQMTPKSFPKASALMEKHLTPERLADPSPRLRPLRSHGGGDPDRGERLTKQFQ